jgi:hypothetical protein
MPLGILNFFRRGFIFLPRLTCTLSADGFLALSAALAAQGLSLDKVRCPLNYLTAGKKDWVGYVFVDDRKLKNNLPKQVALLNE